MKNTNITESDLPGSKQLLFPTILVISLFFLWALTSNLLPILIPHLKKACHLNLTQSSLVDSAYWIAYFCMALPAGMLMRKFGYKKTIITGLLMAAFGAFLFIPAATSRSYPFFLTALFIVASGMTFLETSANPFMTVLGNSETASQRLNFAQAFNGLGAFIASMFISKLIIDKNTISDEKIMSLTPDELNIFYSELFEKVKLPYALIGIILVIVAALFILTKFPVHNKKGDQKSNSGISMKDLLLYPQLTGGIIAQFFYVGAQVCVSSFFIVYARNVAGLSEYEATNYLGLLLLSFMLGRYAGTFLMRYIQPEKLLAAYALINILLMLVVVFAGGKVSLAAFIGVEFFMSIMFPTIFSLAIKGLGDKTAVASSFVVMAIIGGALFPPLLGRIYDHYQSIQSAYIIPLICFVPVLIFGYQRMKKA
jgi:FHS family L-fucose permease-like MFS transporter